MAYFRLKSQNNLNSISFLELQRRLLDAVAARVNNGEITERSLARVLGVSQPQIHHVLKGKRRLQPELADQLLARFGLTLLDLLQAGSEPLTAFGPPIGSFIPASQPLPPRRKGPKSASGRGADLPLTRSGS